VSSSSLLLYDVLLYGVSGSYAYRYCWRVTAIRFSSATSVRLGKNIARLRRAMGISQDALAERLNITTRHMQKLEAGEHAPSLPLLVTIHKTLKTGWEDLFAGL
jgi:DNA-binding XRE family transcriptional regulator